MSGPNAELLAAVNAALRRRSGTRSTGDGELAIRCLEPGHEDRHPSASWSTRRGCGRCHSCDVSWSTKKAAELLGLELPSRGDRNQRERRWEIRESAGAVQANHHRIDRPGADKPIRWWTRPDGSKGLDGRAASSLPLYGAHWLAEYEAGEAVYVCEGEPATDGARRLGLQAVGTVTGASSCPDAEVLRELDGFLVVVWPDHDKAGQSHARRVTAGLRSAGVDVESVVDTSTLWDGAPEDGQDAADLEALPDVGLPLLAPAEAETDKRQKARESGAEVLDQARAFIARFVALPSEDALNAVTLWVAHCHVIGRLDTTARLYVDSPEPESGKTRLVIEVTGALVPNPVTTYNASPAAVVRKIAAGLNEQPAEYPTVLLDEADAIFKPARGEDPSADLRALINSGYRKGAYALRCVGKGHTVTEFPSFCPVAMAGLKKGRPPDSVLSRSIIINMKRRKPGETVEPWRMRKCEPQGYALRDRLAEWAKTFEVGDREPEMPEGVEDRQADIWEPLLIIAELAGGDWPRRGLEACKEFVGGARDADERSLGVKLLAHLCRGIGDIGDTGDTVMGAGKGVSPLSPLSPQGGQGACTGCVVKYLNGDDEAPWGGWHNGQGLNGRSLAGFLKQFGVKSKTARCATCGTRTRGYHTDQFSDAWSRYLPAQAQPPEPGNARGQSDVAHVADTRPATGPPVEAPEGWPLRASDGRPMIVLDIDSDDLVKGSV